MGVSHSFIEVGQSFIDVARPFIEVTRSFIEVARPFTGMARFFINSIQRIRIRKFPHYKQKLKKSFLFRNIGGFQLFSPLTSELEQKQLALFSAPKSVFLEIKHFKKTARKKIYTIFGPFHIHRIPDPLTQYT